MSILTHFFGTWHCQQPSLEISHQCLPRVQCSASIWLLSFLLAREVGQGEKRREEKSMPGKGKAWWGAGLLSLALGRLSLRGCLKYNSQVAQAGINPGRRGPGEDKIFSPHLEESSLLSISSFLGLPPCPNQVHIP